MTVSPAVRRLRLASGLVLLAYVVGHLLNHMAGLVSIPAMETVLEVQRAVWANPLGLAPLYGSAAVHAALSLWGFYRRRDLQLGALEAWQLALGLAIPPLLVLHIAGTRGAEWAFGEEAGYPAVLLIYFVLAPWTGVRQVAALLAVWAHGCLGVHAWLRFRPWYPRWRGALLATAVLVPTLALAGAWMAGRWAQERFAEGTAPFTQALVAQVSAPEKMALVGAVERWTLLAWGAALLALLAARGVRRAFEHRRGVVVLTYADGRRVRVPRGTTILEASRDAGIPHASLCGGRGRCSTCRTRIGTGLERLPPPSAAEARVLERVGAAPDVRLACQTRAEANLEVAPLLAPDVTAREARATRGRLLHGEEREIVVLFADLRGFTRLAERRLPYDVVFLLNRYFRATGEAVEAAGGRVDKFVGDGVMALFGLGEGRNDPQRAARAALVAAQEMVRRLAEIERTLAGDLDAPLRLGIGIHVGPAIVGEMGWGSARGLTAVGDTVNIAARLEQATKDFRAELAISAALAERAGIAATGAERHALALRGRSETLEALVYERADRARVPEPA